MTPWLALTIFVFMVVAVVRLKAWNDGRVVPIEERSWEYGVLPGLTMSWDDRAWVRHHLLLAKSDPSEWPKIIGDAHGYGGVYWMCPREGCTASPGSHQQSGCNVHRPRLDISKPMSRWVFDQGIVR